MNSVRSTASIVARQVRIVVTPPTATLFESSAILAEVQSRFGPISTFINQRNDPVLRQGLAEQRSKLPLSAPHQTIFAIFRSPASKVSAVDSGWLEVPCGGDLVPSANDTDPFNVRDHAGRQRPPKRLFRCCVIDEDDPNFYRLLVDSNRIAQSLGTEHQQIDVPDLFQPTMRSKQRVQLREGAAQAWHQAKRNLEAEEQSSLVSLKEPVEQVTAGCLEGGLMKAWRDGLQNDEKASPPHDTFT